MTRSVALALAVLAVVAVQAAQTSYLDFGKGPAKWIMTGDEQRAWRTVKTEDQARDFVDLFWARRDPTPGTPLNEFRTQFDSRVDFADRFFIEQGRRGSLTERGRVLVVLGFPQGMSADMQKVSGATGNDINVVSVAADPRGGGATDNAGSLTGGRALDARDVWTYTHEQASKFSVPKIEVVFIHDMTGDRVRRDPSRTDFTSALPNAIRSYVVSPDLKEVPPWASSRHAETAELPPQEVVTPTVVSTRTTQTVASTGTTVVEPPPVQAKPAGAGPLALVSDISALQPQSGKDPFASLKDVASFRRDQDLGWAAEYCAGEILADPPAVSVQLRVSSTGGSDPVNMTSEPEEFVPDSIKASPGCYLVRGSLPLGDVEPGSYTIVVTIAGPGHGQRYNLTRAFRIE